ncbi:MAG: cation-translocating P-type ATPase [Chloroflexi bacterium]|nr:cation-translocating P-type ATPase [Chloroflexota bacterium]
MNWHTLKTESALENLQADPIRGLSTAQAVERLAENGPNELVEKGGRTPWQILWEQVTATMVLILIAAAVIAGFLGDTKNLVAILSIVVLYALLGFVQEYRAEKAIAALKKLSVPNVRVLRNGQFAELSGRELVPGDILQLEAGNVIPADVRLLEAVNLRVQEAALTGESEAVEKQTNTLPVENLPLGDRRNLGYMGTIVTQGRGLALVVATGMQTELGKIADLIQQVPQEETPLQKRLDQLGKNLAVVGVVIAALIFVIGLWRGDDIRHMLLTAVSVAVAIVPEGLPAVVTVTLALGAQRMLARKALIRKLPAVETLGSVTVICSDKTGTLTENKMTVVVLDVAGHSVDLTEEMERSGIVTLNRTISAITLAPESALGLLSIGGVLCNDAKLIDQGEGHYHTIGDPTEGALVVAGAKLGFWQDALETDFPRVAEVPFDSERKRMTTVHQVVGKLEAWGIAGNYLALTKGSADGLLEVSGHVWVNGNVEPMDEKWRDRITSAGEKLATRGMRVLGLAFRALDQIPASAEIEQDLTFIGLFAMIDPPRAEVKDAVALTKSAGIRTVMITGDHPLTAVEIARQLGISENGQVLTGAEIERMSFDELKAVVNSVNVFARVSPEHKIKIVQALQECGQIVSMTGDGVNDAPALRRANIGVAMGITGTDVSKEASDLVLLDDNFATIVAAVKEGRTIYDNIRKFVRFSVAGNIGKVLVMLIAPFLGKPIPLLPLQLLWLNLLTDGLLGLGLGVEKSEKDTMQRPPYSPEEGVFSRSTGWQTLWVGTLIGALGLGIGSWYYFGARPEWQTMIFSSLAFAQVGQALASRSNRESLFTLGLGSNPLLLGMAALVTLLQLTVIYLPPVAAFFSVTPLSLPDLLIALGAGILVLATLELAKLWELRS